jgi:hypothetical protein
MYVAVFKRRFSRSQLLLLLLWFLDLLVAFSCSFRSLYIQYSRVYVWLSFLPFVKPFTLIITEGPILCSDLCVWFSSWFPAFYFLFLSYCFSISFFLALDLLFF